MNGAVDLGILIQGTRYFKYDDNGDLHVFKLIKTSPIVLKEISNKEKEIVVLDDESSLRDEFVKLNPDAIINFNIVNIRDLKDVVVTVYRKKEIIERSSAPYSICRQNITDFFANSLDPNMQACGVNVTTDTLPEGVKIEQLTACDGIESYDTVAYYMGESLDDILSYFSKGRKADYDEVLYNLFMDHIEYKSKTSGGKMYINYAKTQRTVDGYCTSLKDLLCLNNFMFDLMRGFNIYPIDIYLKESCENGCLDYNILSILERLICKNINKDPSTQLIIEYDKDIDLERINTDYLLIYDKTNTLYVVAFSTYGKYHIPVEDVESEENIALLAKSIGYDDKSSITEAYNYISFNRDKYK